MWLQPLTVTLKNSAIKGSAIRSFSDRGFTRAGASSDVINDTYWQWTPMGGAGSGVHGGTSGNHLVPGAIKLVRASEYNPLRSISSL